MKKILTIFVVLLALICSFIIGRFTAPKENLGLSVYDCTTFYATIETVNGSTLLVDGLDVNDINFRGKFTLTIDENTRLIWRATEIASEKLQAGARIALTVTGSIQEIYPANIVEPAVQIVLLDDQCT